MYKAEGTGERVQVPPPPSPRRYWTRRELAERLCNELGGVGIDHAFSFPIAYFHHWPTDERATFVDLIRDGHAGHGRNREGDSNWFRLTERWTATTKSVFLFDLQGSVAKSTHAVLPWQNAICPNY